VANLIIKCAMVLSIGHLNQGDSSNTEQEKDEDMPYLKHSIQERLGNCNN